MLGHSKTVVLASAGILALVTVALASAFVAPRSPSRSDNPEVAQTSGALQRAIEFRESFGLRSDPEFVKGMEADDSGDRTFGVALDAAEVADLNNRQERVLAILPGLTEDLTHEPSFAGLFIDQKLNGRLEIRTTGDPALVESLLVKYSQSGVVFNVERVAYTLVELEGVQRAVASDIEGWFKAGLQVATVGVDPRINRVVVTVVDLTESMKAKLVDQYGPRIEVVDGEAPSFLGARR